MWPLKPIVQSRGLFFFFKREKHLLHLLQMAFGYNVFCVVFDRE